MNGQVGKKAVHVKWAGKTIALGTFPIAEADDKCARAKALTRAWRSTMRPKPSREWVMLELERLNVRVVSGRLGNKDAGSDGSDEDEDSRSKPRDHHHSMNAMMDPSLMGGVRRGSITASLLNAADMARGDWGGGGGDRMSSFGLENSLAPMRRNSSLPMSLLGADSNDTMPNLSGGGGGNSSGKDLDPVIPPHRPLVGGGSAAAYEAARADHYRKLAEQKNNKSKNDSSHQSSGRMSSASNMSGGSNNSKNGSSSQRRMSELRSSLGLGSSLGMSGFGNSMSQMRDNNSGGNFSVNPNEHYEMLKLHHMNLLNEIQETTLMMNLYQQQQMQQENLQKQLQMQLQEEQKRQRKQQQEDQRANGFDANMLLENQENGGRLGGDNMVDMNDRNMNGKGNSDGSRYDTMGQRQMDYDNSDNRSRGSTEAPPIDAVPQISHESNENSSRSGARETPSTSSKDEPNGMTSELKPKEEPESEQERKKRELQKIKDEIAERQRILEELERAESSKEDEKAPNADKSIPSAAI